MAGLGQLSGVYSAGLGGFRKETRRLERAAGEIAQASAQASAAVVQISEPASAAAQKSALGRADAAAVGGIEQAFVDMRVAKYSAIANLRVMDTASDVFQELADVGRRR